MTQSTDQLPLFPADSPANHSVPPGSEAARAMTVTSGRRCVAALKNSGPLGFLLKTLLVSSRWASWAGSLTWETKAVARTVTETYTAYLDVDYSTLSWKRSSRSTTPSHRWLFQLRLSVPTIDETESSLLPTPSATEYGTNQSPSPGASVRPSLSTMARHDLLPTPTSGDANRGEYQYDQHDKTKPRPSLLGRARLLPTIRASDGERGGRGDLIQAVRGNPNRHYRLLPTPRVTTNGGSGRHRGDNRGRLEDEVHNPERLLPTPTARDWRTGDRPENRRARMKQGGEWHSPNLNDVAAPGGRLNPEWVEWLMGFPIGWTEPISLPPPTESPINEPASED